jgi:hypothetical protein
MFWADELRNYHPCGHGGDSDVRCLKGCHTHTRVSINVALLSTLIYRKALNWKE